MVYTDFVNYNGCGCIVFTYVLSYLRTNLERQVMKKIFGIALILVAGLSLNSCEDTLVECTGCDATSPWSHPDSQTCYPTKADCEAATGKTCVICT